MEKKARLMYGSTYPEGESANMDLRWLIEIKLSDPHYLIEIDEELGGGILLASSLEYDRARTEAKNCRVMHFDPYLEKGAKIGESPLVVFLHEHEISSLILHPETPVAVSEFLRKKGFQIEVGPRPWFPGRYIRTEAEVLDIEKTQRAIEEVLWLVKKRLEGAEIKDGIVCEKGTPLTSETMRKLVEDELYFRGCLCPMDTICSSGTQAGRPHELGTGPLKANAPIVFDIYPRSRWGLGRYSDCTRTFFKGKPSAQALWIYGLVYEAQELGISLIRDGIDAGELHRKVEEFMGKKGYKLIHGLGHGLNLRCHEPPSVFSKSTSILKEGMVVTVEPGIYLPNDEIGIRLEDLVFVQKNGHRNLTNFPKKFEDAVIL